MNNYRNNGFFKGIIFTLIIFSLITTVYAANKTVSINDGIKIKINGGEFTPKDANDKAVDVFTYNGTTYVPLRAVSQAFGKNINWDNTSKTVLITNPTPILITLGQYIVGEDIEPGKYDVNVVEGFGNFIGDVKSTSLGYLSEILSDGSNDLGMGTSSYSNLRLAIGDKFTVGGNLKLEFVKK